MRIRKSQKEEIHKKRILDVVNQLTAEELERVSEMLRNTDALEVPLEDQHSQTMDAAGEYDGEVRLDEDGNPIEPSEIGDQVEDLLSNKEKVNEDDNLTSVSRARSSSKSMVASLSKQLQDERDARRKLEDELRSLQQVSKEIKSSLKKRGVQ